MLVKEDKMVYLYRHIRLDKNEPFYIGIGDGDNYSRAYNTKRRTKFWKNIVSKTLYDVEILLDNLTWKQACEKEIEFIALYGRIDLNKGTLCNLTNGGEGKNGYKHTDEAKLIISSKLKNQPKPKGFGIGRKILWGNKIGEKVSKAVLQYSKDGILLKEWNSLTEACKHINKPKGMGDITKVCREQQKSAFGFKWKYKTTI